MVKSSILFLMQLNFYYRIRIVLNIDGFINLSFWMKNDDKLNIPTFFHLSVYKKWRRKTNCFKEKNNFLHLFQSQLNG